MNQPTGRQAKQIVYKVYTYYENRKKDRTSLEHQNDINVAKTVSEITGLSPTTVRKIVSEGRSLEAHGIGAKFRAPKKNLLPKKRIEIDAHAEGIIRRKVNESYAVKKTIPTIQTLNAELKEENVIHGSEKYLRTTLQRLGFKFFTWNSNKKVLVENHDIMSLRWHYIQDIKKYREEERPIIYLDERYVYPNHSGKDRADTLNPNLPFGLTVFLAGSRDGLLEDASFVFETHAKTGDYYGQMSASKFQKWVEKKLLPDLPDGSVVVMDDAAYHSTQVNSKPTMTAAKSKLQEWLKQRNVPFDNSLRKCDLLEIISKQNIEKKYRIDEIIKAKGHTVLRLPPNHDDLNPIELVWGEIVGELSRIVKDSNLERKQKILTSLIANYSPEEFSNCDDHVIKVEEEYLKYDQLFDDEFDRLLTSLNDKDDSDDVFEQGEEEESDMETDDD